MATITNVSTRVSIKLNNGYDTSGNVKTLNTSFPSVDVNPDEDKIIAISNSFEDCAASSIYSVEERIVDYISA